MSAVLRGDRTSAGGGTTGAIAPRGARSGVAGAGGAAAFATIGAPGLAARRVLAFATVGVLGFATARAPALATRGVVTARRVPALRGGLALRCPLALGAAACL